MCISAYVISEYEGFCAFLWLKNKANPSTALRTPVRTGPNVADRVLGDYA